MTTPTEMPPVEDSPRPSRRDDRRVLRPLWVLPWAAVLLLIVLVLLSGREVRADEKRAAVALTGFAVIGLTATVESLMLMAISAARHPRLRRWAADLTTTLLGLGVTVFYGVIADAVIRDRHAAAGLLLRLDPIVDGFLGLLLPIAWGGILLVAVAGLAFADAVAAGRARRRAHDERLRDAS